MLKYFYKAQVEKARSNRTIHCHKSFPMKKIALLISTVSCLALAAPAKALSTYTFTSSTGGAVDPSGTFVTASSADNAIVSVTAPFNFTIYETPVTTGQTLRISTNGNIQFTNTGGNTSSNNTALPSGTLGNFPIVMPYWDDLTLTTTGGGIYTSTSGAVGSRVFDIEWRGRRVLDNQTTQNMNFEVRFFENSSTFQIVYGSTGVGPNANGANATVGVQAGNTASSQFTQFSFNQANITPGLRLTATAVPVPFGFSPVAALAFIGANLARRRSTKTAKPEKVTQ